MIACKCCRPSGACIAKKCEPGCVVCRVCAGCRKRFPPLTEGKPRANGDWACCLKCKWKGALRHSLEAPPGYVLAVADSAAIEARKLAWLAGHEVLVEGFRQNLDVYSQFASVAYRRPIDRKARPEDEGPGAVGKVSILGNGYGLGGIQSAIMFAAGPMGNPPIIFDAAMAASLGVRVGEFAEDPEGKNPKGADWQQKRRWRNWRKVAKMPSRLPMPQRLAHAAVADYLVRTYREENAPIVEYWAAMGPVLEAMVDAREIAFGPGGILRTERHAILLPSGLRLRYPGLSRRVEPREVCSHCDEEVSFCECGCTEPPILKKARPSYSYVSGHAKERVRLYGGKLVENIVQALARIVVFEQALHVRLAYGYRVVTTTHDEIVLGVPEAEGPRAVERLIAAMKTPPVWAPGLPLNAEGDCAVSYGEAK